MTSLRRFTLAVFALALTLPALDGARAEAERYIIDPTHTDIVFLVDHLGYSKMIGEFDDVSGSFVFDREDVANSSVQVTVKTASIDTDLEVRDKDLRSPTFLNVQEFPEMTFESTRVEKTGEGTGKVHGELTLLGVTRPLTLDVTFNKTGPNPIPGWENAQGAGFSARTSLERSNWGMDAYLPALGDRIDILIEVEGYLESDYAKIRDKVESMAKQLD